MKNKDFEIKLNFPTDKVVQVVMKEDIGQVKNQHLCKIRLSNSY